MAGVTCARTLQQAGHAVTVFEQMHAAGGRTRTVHTAGGSFDAGAQYFTVRDARFAKALETVSGLCRPWSANTVRVLDSAGRVVSAAPPPGEAHWVAQPTMDALVGAFSRPLAALRTGQRVTGLVQDAARAGMCGSARATRARRRRRVPSTVWSWPCPPPRRWR